MIEYLQRMASAEFADDEEALPSKDLSDAKRVLASHLIEQNKILREYFDREGQPKNIGKCLKLNVLRSSSNGAPNIEQGDTPQYQLVGSLDLSKYSLYPEEKILCDTEMSIQSTMHTSAFVGASIMFKALEKLEPRFREAIAESVIEPHRVKMLGSECDLEVDFEIEALNKEYHHILGDLS